MHQTIANLTRLQRLRLSPTGTGSQAHLGNQSGVAPQFLELVQQRADLVVEQVGHFGLIKLQPPHILQWVRLMPFP
ncbi:hypothetical protein D3C81_2275760 [compost metagenome]